MREPKMFEPMERFLVGKGYRVVAVHKGRERGPDIVAEREGRRLIVEMKGDSQALDVDLGTGIFQLFRHMERDAGSEYALVLSDAYERLVRQVEWPLTRLGGKVFIVGDTVRQLW